MKQYFTILLFLLTAQLAFGQPKVEMKVDSTNMMIGDQMRMELQVKHNSKSVVLLPKGVKLGDKIEVLSERNKVTNISADEILTTKQMTITAFDSGVYNVPPVPVQVETNGIIDTFFQKRFN
ncbi:MAG: hypothetical protein HC803_01825 [Saprospiraceae bacterium]|nr:hypothetical protein [Saprospiraceae bacterium]